MSAARAIVALGITVVLAAAIWAQTGFAAVKDTRKSSSSTQATSSPCPLWDGKEKVADYAKRAGINRVELTLDLGNKATMKLVLIPAGKFMMGSPSGKKNSWDRPPQHEVTISRPFYMGAYHVTRAQWAAFVAETHFTSDAEKKGYTTMSGRRGAHVKGASWKQPGFDQTDEHPVVCVSYHDATSFCLWLSKKTGTVVKLPTEAQWEYACRAGTTTAYPWGDDPDGGKGWANCLDKRTEETFKYNTPYSSSPFFNWDDGYSFTSPVGKFKANAFGLYDTIGNAWQWCSDWYQDYTEAPVTDPKGGPASGGNHVQRGGSWGTGPEESLVTFRSWLRPASRFCDIGFRVIVDLTPGAQPAQPASRPAPPDCSLLLSSDQATYKSGQPIHLKVTLKNKGDQAIGFMEEGPVMMMYDFKVLLPTGLEAPLTAEGKRQQLIDGSTMGGSLQPGKSLTNAVFEAINELFDMTKPGEYTVTVYQTVHPPNGEDDDAVSVASNPIKIVVSDADANGPSTAPTTK